MNTLLDHVCWHKKINKKTTHSLNSYALCCFSIIFKHSLRLDHCLTPYLHTTKHFDIWNCCYIRIIHAVFRYCGNIGQIQDYIAKWKKRNWKSTHGRYINSSSTLFSKSTIIIDHLTTTYQSLSRIKLFNEPFNPISYVVAKGKFELNCHSWCLNHLHEVDYSTFSNSCLMLTSAWPLLQNVTMISAF